MFKVYQATDTKPVATFKIVHDAHEWARTQSLKSSITYKVKMAGGEVRLYFRGEDVPK